MPVSEGVEYVSLVGSLDVWLVELVSIGLKIACVPVRLSVDTL
jgi:hypothetical protein